MRHTNRFLWPLLAASGVGLVGCSSTETPADRLAISVAPLELDGVAEAIYRVTVRNGDPGPDNIVWQQEALESTRYGDGKGAITYIGTCDATRDPHTVELELMSLSDSTHELSSPDDYKNPAPAGSPLRITGIDCKENADTSVVFDLTIMRAAKQGFFDVAVNFSDMFCSAKIDCSPEMLFKDGHRAPTAIFGFACTAGPGDKTFMYLSDLTLTCVGPGGTETISFPLEGVKDGQQGDNGPAVYEWAQYTQHEFPANSELEKCARNYAIGLDTAALAGKSCTLSAIGTASDHALDGNAFPTDAAYPILTWDVEVLTANGALCTNNGLDQEGSHVRSGYVTDDNRGDERPDLTMAFACGGDAPGPLACTPAQTPVGAVSVVPASDPSKFEVQVSGKRLGNFQLAEGWSVASTCCQADCCDGAIGPPAPGPQ